MIDQMLGASHDTDNQTEYALTCNIIRDFCEDAIASGRLPTDSEIHGVVYPYVIKVNDGEHDNSSLMLSPNEAAKLAGVSTRTITRMCESEQIQAVKIRGSWRINRKAYMKLLEGGKR